MPTNYQELRKENLNRYGTDIGRIGPMLLANRYDDRSHFLFELLQNAEDALKRRNSAGPNSVHFCLSQQKLRFLHCGQLFTEKDVRGICGIGESTKAEDLTAIGKFGIGFKAVYAFTDAPEIHSGEEHFAIDSFVWPRSLTPIEIQAHETVFDFPFRKNDTDAYQEIAAALQSLGVRTLLFLHYIDEISWSTASGQSGQFLREVSEVSKNARQVMVLGQDMSSLDVSSETWLVFAKPVSTSNGETAGQVEIAFQIKDGCIVHTPNSTLVVYFPTIVPTNCGLLIQGPYRTTPSRDNVPKHDEWNRYLVQQTSELLIASLHELKCLGLLTVSALRTLPIETTKFGEGEMWKPLFDVVRRSLLHEELLPKYSGGYVAGTHAKLGRTQELRELLTPWQLGQLFDRNEDVFWLSDEITQDRNPLLRSYLISELKIAEVVPETILSKLTKPFMENQSDQWTLSFYEFLHGQGSLQRQGKLVGCPLIRLDDGTHVVPFEEGRPQAFLPGVTQTSFPTIRAAVCASEASRALLIDLGLTEPDPVDDVIWNLLPIYVKDNAAVTASDYDIHIKRILTALATDSKSQRTKLVEALRDTSFVMSVDLGNNSKKLSKPRDVYLATQRLKDLFAGVRYVLIVDDSYQSLHGEDVRELLEACGATRHLQRVKVRSRLTEEELSELRRNAGCERSTGNESIEDYNLRGLSALLETLPTLEPESQLKKVKLLWEALQDLEDRRGARVFSGTYQWFYVYRRNCEFDAAFVHLLNEGAWVPDCHGVLQQPQFVLFSDTGWKEHPFLLSKIRFKPPAIEVLAREAGIEPGLLDLLKKIGLTSEVALKARLGITDEVAQVKNTVNADEQSVTASDAVDVLLGDVPKPTPPPDEDPSPIFPGAGRSNVAGGSYLTSHNNPGHYQRPDSFNNSSFPLRLNTRSHNNREFISYVATHPHESHEDPDGLTYQQRLNLEEEAIKKVLMNEPQFERTTKNNPGFDLVELDEHGHEIRWVEVKAMKGTLQNRPVGLSKTQFEHAQRKQDSYWLYIVEQADTEGARIIRIKDPAGKAQTFTFDHGWLSVAIIDEAEL